MLCGLKSMQNVPTSTTSVSKVTYFMVIAFYVLSFPQSKGVNVNGTEAGKHHYKVLR